MRYIVFHLSVTSFDDGTPAEKSETIALGAVEMPGPRTSPTARYETPIRPMAFPILSEVCRQRTGLTQHDADRARPFYLAFREFLEWLGPEPFVPCGWGTYDLQQLQRECERHKIALPADFDRWVNLKQRYSDRWKRPATGLSAALREREFPAPRGGALESARAVARLARELL